MVTIYKTINIDFLFVPTNYIPSFVFNSNQARLEFCSEETKENDLWYVEFGYVAIANIIEYPKTFKLNAADLLCAFQICSIIRWNPCRQGFRLVFMNICPEKIRNCLALSRETERYFHIHYCLTHLGIS